MLVGPLGLHVRVERGVSPACGQLSQPASLFPSQKKKA